MLNPQISNKMRLQFGELNITPRVVNRLHELDFTVPELEDAIAAHKSPCDGEPSVYVGTYGKYNVGGVVLGKTFPRRLRHHKLQGVPPRGRPPLK